MCRGEINMSFEAVNRELREETQAISDLSDINKITTDRIFI